MLRKVVFLNSVSIFIIGIVFLISIVVPFDYELFYPYLYLDYGFVLNVVCGVFLMTLFIISNNGRLNKGEISLFALIVIAELYVFISAYVVGGGLRYVGVIVNTMVYAFVIRKIHISPRLYRFLFYVVFFFILMYAFNASGYYEKQWSQGGESIDVNSNYIGTLAIVLLSFLYISSRYFKNKQLISLLCFIGNILSLYIILQCKSRASLGAWIIFSVLYYLVPSKILMKKGIGILVFGIVLAFGFLFPFIYVNHSPEFGSISALGRTTLTRVSVYKYVTEHIFESPLFSIMGHGTYSEMNKVFLHSSAHNAFYQIWYDIGLIGVSLFVIFFCKFIHQLYSQNEKLDAKQLVVFISFVSYQFIEGFSVSIRTGLAIWGFMILGELLKPLPVSNMFEKNNHLSINFGSVKEKVF